MADHRRVIAAVVSLACASSTRRRSCATGMATFSLQSASTSFSRSMLPTGWSAGICRASDDARGLAPESAARSDATSEADVKACSAWAASES